MRRAVLIAMLLATGCATVPDRSAQPWLVGIWLMIEDDTQFPLACESGLPIRYDSNGRYFTYEEIGTWRLDGGRLTETATELNDTVEERAPELGRPYVSQVEHTGPDELRKTFAGGEQATFRRCP